MAQPIATLPAALSPSYEVPTTLSNAGSAAQLGAAGLALGTPVTLPLRGIETVHSCLCRYMEMCAQTQQVDGRQCPRRHRVGVS